MKDKKETTHNRNGKGCFTDHQILFSYMSKIEILKALWRGHEAGKPYIDYEEMYRLLYQNRKENFQELEDIPLIQGQVSTFKALLQPTRIGPMIEVRRFMVHRETHNRRVWTKFLRATIDRGSYFIRTLDVYCKVIAGHTFGKILFFYTHPEVEPPAVNRRQLEICLAAMLWAQKDYMAKYVMDTSQLPQDATGESKTSQVENMSPSTEKEQK